MSGDTLLVGAVAYHPRIVTIWERFRDYFAEAGVPTDYVLYSNYERLVDALLSGEVDIGWNTNTAYVAAERRIGGDARLLGMRDVDADFRTVVATRRGESFESASELAGKRLALGSRDSGHAAILPLYYLEREGLGIDETQLVRFDTDLGKHGDTGDSELRVVEAVADGNADAGALGDATWAAPARRRTPGGRRARDRLAQPDLLPLQLHCPALARPGACSSVERGAARDELRRAVAPAGDGPRGRQALAPCRQGRVCRPHRGNATSRACSSERPPLRDGAARARRRARSPRLGGARNAPAGRRARRRHPVARIRLRASAWARMTGHESSTNDRSGPEPTTGSSCGCGAARSPGCSATPPGGHDPPVLSAGGFATDELRRIAGPAPTDADPTAGLIPLGAAPERGAPATAGRSARATDSGPTSSRGSPTAPPARSGTRPPMSPGKPHAGSSPTSNEQSPR